MQCESTLNVRPCRAAGGLADWRGLAAALGERVFMEADSQQLYADALTGELGRELENGRLLRVLVKLSTVTERPEQDSDPQWSETGTSSPRLP
jgi:hypothetical protein